MNGKQQPARSAERLSPEPSPDPGPAEGEQYLADGNGARAAARWRGCEPVLIRSLLLLYIRIFVIRKFSVQNRRFFLSR